VKFPEEKILSDSQIIDFNNQNDFASAADYLFNSQLKNWRLMKDNYDALKNIQTKAFWFEGIKFNLQYNPERIKSTSALVDEKSITKRPCFLCTKNLPQTQKGIVLNQDFVLLCNPYPIFPQHFTITALEHKPQMILDHFGEFLVLTKTLSPRYTMIYNGPACGASAPDHLHFQAGTKNIMPIENDTANVVVSNCVLNLVPDKQKAFAEMHRIINPGGHFCVSDIVLKGELPEGLQKSAAMYAGCVAGAVQQEEYLKLIEEAGFKNVEIKKTKVIELPDDVLKNYLNEEEMNIFKGNKIGIFSITVVGYKN